MTVSPPIDAATPNSIAPHPRGEEPKTNDCPLPPVVTLFAWDFDWTIVNCNSDEYVPSRFDVAAEERLRGLIRSLGPDRWHDCVASLINSCVAEGEGRLSRHEVCEAAASMPYLADVRRSLEDVAADAAQGQVIVSDGNDEFISAFLKKNDLERCFTHGIETNFGIWEEGTRGGDAVHAFSVVHQSSKYGGHSCGRCPPNLCKSQVLRNILSRINRSSPENGDTSRPRIVYVGDGFNDACPALHVLNEEDVLLARDGAKISDPNSRMGPQEDAHAFRAQSGQGKFAILSALKRAEREGLVPKCRVCTWNSGMELRGLVRSLLDGTLTAA